MIFPPLSGSARVAPLAGAWIETRMVQGVRLYNGSRPSRARGLKLRMVQGVRLYNGRAPRGRVD